MRLIHASHHGASIWDKVAQELQQNGGVASLSLSSLVTTTTTTMDEQQEQNSERIITSSSSSTKSTTRNTEIDWSHFFKVARDGMNHCKTLEYQQKLNQQTQQTVNKRINNNGIPFIQPNQDSAHVTGWHSAGCEIEEQQENDTNSSRSSSSLSRYNEYREGFIFSDGELFDLDVELDLRINDYPSKEGEDRPTTTTTTTTTDENKKRYPFKTTMKETFQYLHNDIAKNVLRGIARRMEIEDNWFETNLGPSENASQWHVKRYVYSSTSGSKNDQPQLNQEIDKTMNHSFNSFNGQKTFHKSMKNEKEVLPMHTDPSLISIVIHDQPGENEGGLGLQYLSTSNDDNHNNNNNNDNNDNNNPAAPSTIPGTTKHPNDSSIPPPKSEKKIRSKTWKNIPAHGHGVATIFTGSVLSLLTGGYFPAACHRVIQNKEEEETPLRIGTTNGDLNEHSIQSYKAKERMAVTLFVRPFGKAMLQVPPSTILMEKKVKVKNMTFDAWNAKVARNYMKKNKKNKVKPRGTANEQNGGSLTTINGNRSNEKKQDSEYFRDDYTELSILTATPPLTGREKYLGGELGDNNIIYTIPGHAKQVLAIDPTLSTITPIGPKYDGEFKWLRAVKVPDTGVIYGIPCHANCILKIIPEDGHVSTFGHEEVGAERNELWKWHGGVFSAHDGCIYCIPQFAERVLKIDPKNNDAVTLIGPRLEGRNKWYGGLLGKTDGAIYGIPQNAKGVLRIDPKTQLVTVHGDFEKGGYKWHGGVVGKTNGLIYGIPAHADRVLKITPGLEPKLELIGNHLRTGSHRTDGKYKFLGGVCGLSECDKNNIYLFPSDTDYVVQINVETDEVREVGPSLITLERIRQNKWQNGFVAPDGVIYGIPLKSESILRIRPRDGDEPEITTIGGPFKGLNKWEGGVMALDGSMYCMPLNHRGVLRMRPLGGS